MRTVALGDVAQLVRGVTFDGSEAHSVEANGLLPILRAGNIGDRLLLEDDLVWVPAARVGPDQLMRVGDIAVCLSSGSPAVVGKSAMLDRPFPGSVGAFCGIVRPLDDIDATYLAYWLRSPSYRAWRDSQSRGANIQNLRMSQLAQIEVPLPPIATQRRMAAALTEQLNSTDQAREALRRHASLTESLWAAILRHAFLEAAAHSPSVPLGQVVAEARPGFASGSRSQNGIVQVRMNNVTPEGGWDWSQVVRVPDRDVKADIYLLKPGDLLFNNTNSVELVGKSAVFTSYDEPVVYSNHFTRLRLTKDADTRYVSMWLRDTWLQRVFSRICQRWVGQAAVRTDALLALELPLPAPEVQRRIARSLGRQLAEVDRLRIQLRSCLRVADELGPALVRRALLERVARPDTASAADDVTEVGDR